jgi:hypothetical protein
VAIINANISLSVAKRWYQYQLESWRNGGVCEENVMAYQALGGA